MFSERLRCQGAPPGVGGGGAVGLRVGAWVCACTVCEYTSMSVCTSVVCVHVV